VAKVKSITLSYFITLKLPQMKKILFIIGILLSSFINAQEYSFSKCLNIVMLKKQSGQKEKRLLSTEEGIFKIKFHNSTDEKLVKDIFVLIKPSDSLIETELLLPSYYHRKDMGYSEFEGKIFKECLYYYSKTQETVMVLFATDFSRVIILQSDDTSIELWK